MKTRFIVSFALLVMCSVARAQDAPDAQALIQTAHTQSDLNSLDPYKLTASFVVTHLDKKGRPNLKKQQTGTLTIFRDRERVRLEAQLGPEHETQIQVNQTRYVDPRGTLIAMYALGNLDQSWDAERAANGKKRRERISGKPSSKKIHDTEAWCLGKEKEELCFAVSNRLVVTAGRYQFSDYQKAGEVQFPRQVEIERREMPPVKIIEISVTRQAVDAATFQVPENLVAVEECEDRKPPKSVSTPEPDFTESARKHKGGFAEVNLIISKDGQVIGAQPLTEDPYGLAQQSINKVLTWKFTPATCAGQPINTEMNVEFSFNMY
jgi:hypothetical protein